MALTAQDLYDYELVQSGTIPARCTWNSLLSPIFLIPRVASDSHVLTFTAQISQTSSFQTLYNGAHFSLSNNSSSPP
jgi:hypothetical protein